MFKDRYILAATTITIIALQVILWPLILKAQDLPTEIVFWYTQTTSQRLAPVAYIWIIPAIALASWLINSLLGWRFYRRYPAITRLLFTISATVAVLATITVIKTILIYIAL